MANLVPVGQLTKVQAHQEVTKLVDQISAKFVQLDSGEFGAVARCQNAQASCFVCPYNPTMPKARFIHSGSFASTTFFQALSGLFQLIFL